MSQSIDKVGVIGAGQMGSGIALVCAQAGYDVRAAATSPRSASRRRSRRSTALLSRQVAKGQLDENGRNAMLGRIERGADARQAFGDCDLVIEAASENEEVKRKIFTSLRPFVKPDAIVASNTSSISITRLAAVTANPERFIGMHFMNPVPRMQLVELIRGIATEDDTFEAAEGVRRAARQDADDVGGLSRLHRQPHPAADDQRGGLHALRGRRLGRVDRHRDAARRQPSDGAAAARRLHRPRHLPLGDAGAARGPRRLRSTGPARCW